MTAGRPPASGSGDLEPLAEIVGREELEALRDAASRPDARRIRQALGSLLAEAADRAGEGSLLDEELRVAQRIQRSLVFLPPADLEGWEIASDYRPAREIGGDFFDVFPLLDPERGHELCLVMADVSGKGISAALLMAFLRPLIRAALDRTGDPVAALERTNWILVTERHTGMFVTVLAGVLDTRTGVLRYANAGHEMPLLVPGDGAPVRPVPGGGPLIGLFGRLDLVEEQLQLHPGDLLTLFTDGVTDAAGASGERYGEPRLRAALEASRGRAADATVAEVVGQVVEFQAGAPAADDLALVAVRRRP